MWFKPRPYRNVPIEDLWAARDKLYKEVTRLSLGHYEYIVKPVRKELKLVSTELDRRK